MVKILKFKFEIPYMDIYLNRDLKPKIKLKQKDTSKGKELSGKKSILNIREIKNTYEKTKDLNKLYGSSFRYIGSKMHIEHIKLHTSIGTGSAGSTGVTVGFVYMLVYNLLKLIDIPSDGDNIDIRVMPEYSRPVFEMYLHCIIRIRIANIIIGGIKILFAFVTHAISKKGGVSSERASYTGLNENYNGQH